jgi:hypothetical protein
MKQIIKNIYYMNAMMRIAVDGQTELKVNSV